MYEVWTADLNSLYDTLPMEPVFAEDVEQLQEAFKIAKSYQTPDVAAWVKNKETGEIVPFTAN